MLVGYGGLSIAKKSTCCSRLSQLHTQLEEYIASWTGSGSLQSSVCRLQSSPVHELTTDLHVLTFQSLSGFAIVRHVDEGFQVSGFRFQGIGEESG